MGYGITKAPTRWAGAVPRPLGLAAWCGRRQAKVSGLLPEGLRAFDLLQEVLQE